MNDKPVRVRIAPSPTGDPHIGTAYMELFDYVFAHQSGGRFILRIEDTDRERFNESSAQAILDSLNWLGLTPDEGPTIGGPVGPYVQSERLPIYKKHVEQLVEAGQAYHCFCTKARLTEMRAAQEAAKQDIIYDRHCLNTLSDEERRKRAEAGEPHVIRMKMPQSGVTTFTDLIRGEITFENALLDDQIILKADGYPTYHLAVVVDDHLMGITHVTRAEEWISSTPKHIVLFNMFGWEIPQFAHFPLLRNPDRSKMSKRHSHTSLRWYREQGFLPEALLNFLALLGWSHPQEKEIFTLQELIEKFSFERFNKTGPIFDLEKLRWMNGLYIRELPIDRLYELAAPFLQRAKVLPENPTPEAADFAKRCLALEQGKAATLADFPDLVSFIINPNFEFEDEALSKWLRSATADKPAPEHVLPAFNKLMEKIGALTESAPTAEIYEAILRAVAEELGVGAGKAIHPTRVALSGRTKGPSLFHLMELLGKEEVLRRLKRAREMMGKATQ
jgi:glutamyl-tRNA synthetase